MTTFPDIADYAFLSDCEISMRGCAGYRKSVMPNRNGPLSEIKTTKQGSWRKPRKGETARRIELYGSAYKLAWEQIPPDQKTRAARYNFAHRRFYPARI